MRPDAPNRWLASTISPPTTVLATTVAAFIASVAYSSG